MFNLDFSTYLSFMNLYFLYVDFTIYLIIAWQFLKICRQPLDVSFQITKQLHDYLFYYIEQIDRTLDPICIYRTLLS